MNRDPLVLVAEEDTQSCELLATFLDEEGYRVMCASEGTEASHLLASMEFDAALLDIRMPGKDGLTLLREVHASKRPAAILIVTAYSTSALTIEVMKLGAHNCLTKPLHFDDLLIQLKRAVTNRQAGVEAYPTPRR